MTREEIVNKLLEGGKLIPVMTEFEAREVVNYVLDNYYQQAHVVQPDYTYNSKEFLEKKIEELYKEVEVLKKEQPQGIDEAAEEIASDIAPTHPDIGWDECFEKIKEGIKAGAEWMAGLGHSYEGVIYDDHEVLVGGYPIEFRDFFLPFKYCDKVIVQIRKINEKDE